MNTEATVSAVRTWIEQLVVGEKLCPFAGQPLQAGRVRFAVTTARTEPELLEALSEEFDRLLQSAELETTLLIHPEALTDFADYNQFLDLVDELIVSLDLEGVFQVASFHPHYQFAETEPGDAENSATARPIRCCTCFERQASNRPSRTFPE